MVSTRTPPVLLPNRLITILIEQGTLPLQHNRTPLWTTLAMKKCVGPLAYRLPLKQGGELGNSLPICPTIQLIPNPEAVETGTTLVPGSNLPYVLISLISPLRPSKLTPPTSSNIGMLKRFIPLIKLPRPLGALIILAIHSNILVLANVEAEKPSTDLRNPQPGPNIFGALENITRTLLAPQTFTT